MITWPANDEDVHRTLASRRDERGPWVWISTADRSEDPHNGFVFLAFMPFGQTFEDTELNRLLSYEQAILDHTLDEY